MSRNWLTVMLPFLVICSVTIRFDSSTTFALRYPPYGFITRLKPDGSGLIYSTYIGGGGSIIMGSIAVDPQGNAFVFGAADSTSFPTTPGALQPSRLPRVRL